MNRTITSLMVMCAASGLMAEAARAQVQTGDVVTKDDLTRTILAGPDGSETLELVRAMEGQLTTMVVRDTARERPGGIREQRETFIALHGRPGEGSVAHGRGVVAVREDSHYRVLYVAESDVAYVDRLETIELPGAPSRARLLHVRYAQTGSGGVTEDRLFALAAPGHLVEVPIVHGDLQPLLADGEYFCCGRFTSFDPELVELTVFVTSSGRSGITHRVVVPYELEGRFRYDAPSGYVPDFRLTAGQPGAREPVGTPKTPS